MSESELGRESEIKSQLFEDALMAVKQVNEDWQRRADRKPGAPDESEIRGLELRAISSLAEKVRDGLVPDERKAEILEAVRKFKGLADNTEAVEEANSIIEKLQ